MSRKERLFIWLISINAIALVVSNLMATKLTVFCGISVDCGIFMFPVTYVTCDLLVEFFGKNRANLCVYAAGLLDLLATIAMLVAVGLPPYPGWEGQAAFARVFLIVPRVVLGSTFAFVASGVVNNLVYGFIQARTNDSRLALRVLGSSAIARVVDIVVFETIAFLGVLSLEEFISQAVFAYFAGFAIETLLYLFLTRPFHRWVQHYLQKSSA